MWKSFRDSSNTLSAEPRMSLVSWCESVLGTVATHRLQSQGWTLSASLKGCQDSSNSPTAESRMTLVSWCERVPGQQQLTSCRAKNGPGQVILKGARTAATHKLQSQEWAWSAGLEGCQGQQQLTVWRAKGELGQQAWKGTKDSSHSHPAEPRAGLFSRLERVSETAATHSLQSQGWALSAGLKGCQSVTLSLSVCLT